MSGEILLALNEATRIKDLQSILMNGIQLKLADFASGVPVEIQKSSFFQFKAASAFSEEEKSAAISASRDLLNAIKETASDNQLSACELDILYSQYALKLAALPPSLKEQWLKVIAEIKKNLEQNFRHFFTILPTQVKNADSWDGVNDLIRQQIETALSQPAKRAAFIQQIRLIPNTKPLIKLSAKLFDEFLMLLRNTEIDSAEYKLLKSFIEVQQSAEKGFSTATIDDISAEFLKAIKFVRINRAATLMFEACTEVKASEQKQIDSKPVGQPQARASVSFSSASSKPIEPPLQRRLLKPATQKDRNSIFSGMFMKQLLADAYFSPHEEREQQQLLNPFAEQTKLAQQRKTVAEEQIAEASRRMRAAAMRYVNARRKVRRFEEAIADYKQRQQTAAIEQLPKESEVVLANIPAPPPPPPPAPLLQPVSTVFKNWSVINLPNATGGESSASSSKMVVAADNPSNPQSALIAAMKAKQEGGLLLQSAATAGFSRQSAEQQALLKSELKSKVNLKGQLTKEIADSKKTFTDLQAQIEDVLADVEELQELPTEELFNAVFKARLAEAEKEAVEMEQEAKKMVASAESEERDADEAEQEIKIKSAELQQLNISVTEKENEESLVLLSQKSVVAVAEEVLDEEAKDPLVEELVNALKTRRKAILGDDANEEENIITELDVKMEQLKVLQRERTWMRRKISKLRHRAEHCDAEQSDLEKRLGGATAGAATAENKLAGKRL